MGSLPLTTSLTPDASGDRDGPRGRGSASPNAPAAHELKPIENYFTNSQNTKTPLVSPSFVRRGRRGGRCAELPNLGILTVTRKTS